MGFYIYPFKLRDERTGRWYRARWHASAEDIAKRRGVIDGPAFCFIDEPLEPYRNSDCMRPPPGPLDPVDMVPIIAPEEAALVRLFLRRYVTWCARAKRYAAMEGASRLYRSLPTSRGIRIAGGAT